MLSLPSLKSISAEAPIAPILTWALLQNLLAKTNLHLFPILIVRPLRIQFREENKCCEAEIARLKKEKEELGSYWCEDCDISIEYHGIFCMCDGKCINCMHGNRCQVEYIWLWCF